jgi:Leucine-rich repeat (LRR) protein
MNTDCIVIISSFMVNSLYLNKNLRKSILMNEHSREWYDIYVSLMANKKLCQPFSSLQNWKGRAISVRKFDGLKDWSCTTVNKSLRCLFEIPPEVGNYARLMYLDLSQNNLSTLPEEFSNIGTLSSLILNDNKFTEFPSCIGNFIWINNLVLSHNNITKIPEDMGSVLIEELELTDNQIREIPESLLSLETLHALCLDNNLIEYIPPFMKGFMNLDILSINNNKLSELINVPIDLTMLYASFNPLKSATLSKSMVNLDVLVLSHTGLTEFPFFPEEYCKSKTFDICDLSFNKITNLPQSFPNVTRLRLEYNILSDFRPEKWVNTAKVIDISWNYIKTVKFGENSRLEYMDLSGNSLECFPDLSRCSGLSHLFISSNGIQTFSVEYGLPKNLTYLDISNNLMCTIPPSVVKSTNLTHLNFSKNKLAYIPTTISNLCQLKILNLYGNPITRLPNSISQIECLHIVNIRQTSILESELSDDLVKNSNIRILSD